MHHRQFRLLELHQRIDEALRRELKRRFPNGFQLLRLKKLKLRVKDRLHGIATPRRRAALANGGRA